MATPNVIEPSTGKSFPAQLENGDKLMGVGCRLKRIGFVEVKVYGMGLYVDEAGARNTMCPQNLKPGSDEFYEELIKPDGFRKSVLLILARNLSESQILGGFSEGLKPRIEKNPEETIGKLAAVVKGGKFTNDMKVLVTVENGSFTFKIGNSPGNPIESPDLCKAFLGIYFDESPIHPPSKQSMVQGFVKLLSEGPADSGLPSSADGATEQSKPGEAVRGDRGEDDEEDDDTETSGSNSASVDLSKLDTSDMTESETAQRFSGKRESGEVLVGVAPRIKKIGFIEVKAYALGFYVDPAGAATELARYKGLSVGTLDGDESFYKTIINGPFQKVFVLQFSRNVTESQLNSSLVSNLELRLEKDVRTEIVTSLKAQLAGLTMATDDKLEFHCGTDDTVKIYHQGKLRGSIKDAPAFAPAIADCYFGVGSAVGDKKRGLISRVPALLDATTAEEVHTIHEELQLLRQSVQERPPGTKVKFGYLWKKHPTRQGILLASWSKRWCKLQDTKFYYFKKKSDKRPLGQIDLAQVDVNVQGLKTGKQLLLGKRGEYFVFSIQGKDRNKRTWHFSADDQDEGQEWVDFLQEAAEAKSPAGQSVRSAASPPAAGKSTAATVAQNGTSSVREAVPVQLSAPTKAEKQKEFALTMVALAGLFLLISMIWNSIRG